MIMKATSRIQPRIVSSLGTQKVYVTQIVSTMYLENQVTAFGQHALHVTATADYLIMINAIITYWDRVVSPTQAWVE